MKNSSKLIQNQSSKFKIIISYNKKIPFIDYETGKCNSIMTSCKYFREDIDPEIDSKTIYRIIGT